MSERTFNWKNKDIRAQVDVVDSKLASNAPFTECSRLKSICKTMAEKKHLDLSGPHCLCGS